MPTVTLTTDWIQEDYYVGAIKGKLTASCPDLKIIDITHSIPPFNTARAAFVIKNSFHHFPEGTIHLIFVNAEPSKDETILAIEYKGHYFIGNDNGIFGLIFRDEPSAIAELPVKSSNQSFLSLEVYTGAACHLASHGTIEGLGRSRESFNRSVPRRATIEQDIINGSVIHIDSYQNAITNITKELFERIGNGRQFEIALQSNYYKITRINQTYTETSVGELLALFNSLNLLEIAINKGNASELLNLTTSSTIRIKFFNIKKGPGRLT